MIPSCLPQKSQCVQAAINTSSIALFSKCLIATGTASAWSAATARHNWRTSASPGVTVSTAKTISSSEQLSENKPVLNKTLIINFFFFQFPFMACWMRCILMATFCFQKEIRDQVRSMSAGDSAHTGGEEGAGLRLPPALLCLHCMQAATCDRWRVLFDGGQQAGLQGRLRDRQAERWAADMIASRVTDRETVGKSVCQTPGSGMLYFVCLLVLCNLPWQTSSLNFDPPALIASLPPNRSILNCIKRRSGGLHLHSALERISFQ